MSAAYMIVLGVVAGMMSGIFGIGGGIIIVPILLFVFGLKYHAATGTSLVALLLPVGFFGVWYYYKSGKIVDSDVLSGLMIALGMFLGTYLGAKIAVPIPEVYLRKGFAFVLCAAALKTWFSR